MVTIWTFGSVCFNRSCAAAGTMRLAPPIT